MTYLEFLATIIIGYILGRLSLRSERSEKQELDALIDRMAKGLPWSKEQRHRANFLAKREVGAVSAPTQQDILRKENPKLAEEEDEMRKAFGNMEVVDGQNNLDNR